MRVGKLAARPGNLGHAFGHLRAAQRVGLWIFAGDGVELPAGLGHRLHADDARRQPHADRGGGRAAAAVRHAQHRLVGRADRRFLAFEGDMSECWADAADRQAKAPAAPMTNLRTIENLQTSHVNRAGARPGPLKSRQVQAAVGGACEGPARIARPRPADIGGSVGPRVSRCAGVSRSSTRTPADSATGPAIGAECAAVVGGAFPRARNRPRRCHGR